MTKLVSIIICILLMPALLHADGFFAGGVKVGSGSGPPPPPSCPTGQTCFFVDSQIGSDSFDGQETTHTTGTTGPFASISKANSMVSSIGSGGGQILFKSGQMWTASATNTPFVLGDTAAHSNANTSATHRILIGTYGGTAKAIFEMANAAPFCIGEINPANQGDVSNPVQYITIDNFECRHSYAYGMVFAPNGTVSPGMIISNNNIHNTGFGCSVTNGACKPLVGAGTNSDPPDWLPSHTYTANTSTTQTIIRPSNGWWYIQSATSCKSGASPPSFPTTYGQSVSDGSPACVWTNTGMKLTYKNQLQEYASSAGANGFHIINNTVNNGGGHNCLQVEADTGALLVQGNIVGPGCVHGGMDFKDIGSAATPALAINNKVTCGYSTGQCGCNNEGSIGNDICGPNAGNCAGSTGVACDPVPGIYTSTVGSTGWLPSGCTNNCNSEFVQYEGNISYDSPVGFQDQPNGTNGCQGSACPLNARYYNNTAYTPPAQAGFRAFYQGNSGANSTLDLRNNLFDGNSISTGGSFLANSPTGGFSTHEDYNNIGGKQGNTGCSFNGGACKREGHDIPTSGSVADPKYVNAAALDFDFLLGSPDINTGLSNLPNNQTNNNNIGAYAGNGQ